MQDIPKDPYLRKEYYEKQLREAVPLIQMAIEKGFPDKANPVIDNSIATLSPAWLETIEILHSHQGVEAGDFLGSDYHLVLAGIGVCWSDPADGKYYLTPIGSFIAARLSALKPKRDGTVVLEDLTKNFVRDLEEFKSTEEFEGRLRNNPEFVKMVEKYLPLWPRELRDALHSLCDRTMIDYGEPTHLDYNFLERHGLAFEAASDGYSPTLRPTYKANEAYHAFFRPDDPEIPNWWKAAGFTVEGRGAPLGAKEMPHVTLKRFTTTKRVWGSIIKGAYVVHRVGSEHKHISLEVEDCQERLPFPHAFFENHRDAFLKIQEEPQYLVIYENGYASLCPKAEFEKYAKQM